MSTTTLTDRVDEKLNQTQIDHAELNSTDVSPFTASVFSWAFALALFAIPVCQAAIELSRAEPPQALAVFQPFLKAVRHLTTGDWQSFQAVSRAGVAPEALHSYEAALENASVFKGFFQPRIQQILTGVLRTGSDQVVLGRDGWLFYKPGLEYVVHPSIIDPSTLDLAAKRMVDKGLETSPHPDPRPALLQLHADSRQAGIRLIVFPVPDKAMLQPAQLSRGAPPFDTRPAGNNTGYAQLVNEMTNQGVDWFDATPRSFRPVDVRFLEQDTHWNPEYMDAVAQDLAAHIRQLGVLDESTPPVAMRLAGTQVSRVGDLVDMLKIGPVQSLFVQQAVAIQQVIDERSGRPIEPDATAEVLLVGDSFTNIYSLSEMGWGTGAGFAEHLAYHLGRPIDVIAFNGGGATRAREALARPDNAERLGHKKVIVYEFAVRNLLGENWKPIPMIVATSPTSIAARRPDAAPAGSATGDGRSKEIAEPIKAPPERAVERPSEESPTASFVGGTADRTDSTAGSAAEELVVVGRIVQTSKVPAPGTAPYKDCLTFIKVQVESVEAGAYEGTDLLAVFWAMKNNEWLPAASYAVGDRLRMTAIPFSQAGTEIRGMQRADDTEDYTLRPFYVLRESREP